MGQEGEYGTSRGICQERPESPCIWNAFNDVLLNLQEDYNEDDDPIVLDTNGAASRVMGVCFADDTFWLSGSRRRVELKINVSALFLEFMGMAINMKKSWVAELEFLADVDPYSPVKYRDRADSDWRLNVRQTEDLFGTGD